VGKWVYGFVEVGRGRDGWCARRYGDFYTETTQCALFLTPALYVTSLATIAASSFCNSAEFAEFEYKDYRLGFCWMALHRSMASSSQTENNGTDPTLNFDTVHSAQTCASPDGKRLWHKSRCLFDKQSLTLQ
jgi:hypothetical protein